MGDQPPVGAPGPDEQRDESPQTPGDSGTATATATPPPTTPPPGATPRADRRVVRREDGRVIGGVGAGVATVLDLDPVLVRIGFVVLAVGFPPLILGYLAAWALLPRQDVQGGPVRPAPRSGAGYWFGIGLVGLLVIGAAAALDGDGAPLIALALVGLGVALYRRDESARPAAVDPAAVSSTATSPAWPVTTGSARVTADASSPPGAAVASPSVDPDATPAGPVPPTGGTPPGGDGPGGVGGAPTPEWPAVPTRQRSPLGLLTIALALIASGVVAALGVADVLAPTWSQLASPALLVIGLGLVVGGVVGRARWLILPALVLLPVVTLAPVGRAFTVETGIDLPGPSTFADGVGERTVRITDASQLGDVVFGIGDLRVDLTALELDESAALAVSQTVGQLTVLLPEDVAWDVEVDLGVGDLMIRRGDGTRERYTTDDVIFGVDLSDGEAVGPASGGGLIDAIELRGGPVDAPILELDVELDLGEITIVEPDTENLS